jgi:hypothetical protein
MQNFGTNIQRHGLPRRRRIKMNIFKTEDIYVGLVEICWINFLIRRALGDYMQTG